MPAKFTTFAAAHKPLIEDWLHDFLQQELAQATDTPDYLDLLEQIAILVARGGKRLRPLLCMMTYQGYGGQDVRRVMPAAAAQELLHTFLLMHDDIIDRDNERWGGPNIVGAYYERYASRMTPHNALHFAQAQSLLAGDVCQQLAMQAVLTADVSPSRRLRLQALYSKVMLRTLKGELADVAFSHSEIRPSAEQVLAMYYDKTAGYSLVLPLQTGAILAGAPASELQVLKNVGQLMGGAYQMQDDLLGMFGSAKKTGKSQISDLREGKYTLLVAKTLQLASADQQRTFNELFGSDKVGDDELRMARNIIRQSGAYSWLRERIEADVTDALQLLESTKLSQVAKQQLTDLAQSLIVRNN